MTATLVLALGLIYDTRPQTTTEYPFIAEPVGIGQRVDQSVEWRTVPAGILPEFVGMAGGVASTDLTVGMPLTPALVAEPIIPEGWWTVPLEVAYPVGPGSRIRVGVDGHIAEGITAGAVNDSGYSLTVPVAFMAEEAALVASATDALVVMIGPEDPPLQPGG